MTQLQKNPRPVLVLLVTLLGSSMFVACGNRAIDPNSVGDPVRGEEIFMNGTELMSTACANCHSLDGNEIDDHNPGPPMLGISEAAATRVEGQTAVDYLRESIVDPGAHVVEGYRNTMETSYQYLIGEEDIENLVAFLLTQ